MELREYIVIIKKRAVIIILLAVLTTLASFLYTFFYLENVYEAYTTIYAGRQIDVQVQQAYQDIIMGQALVKDYKEIAKSKLVSQKVKAELAKEDIKNASVLSAIKLSDGGFAGKITVTPRADTRIIEIRVSDGDPEACAIIANKVAIVFRDTAIQLLKLENVQIVDKAEVSRTPVSPNKKMNIAIGLFAGLLAGFGLAFALEYLDNTIKTPDDITKHLELTVLGVIPKFDLIHKKELD